MKVEKCELLEGKTDPIIHDLESWPKCSRQMVLEKYKFGS